MSSGAESSVVVSLRELMELESERVRSEAEQEQRRREEALRNEKRAAEAADGLEARRQMERQEHARGEERPAPEENPTQRRKLRRVYVALASTAVACIAAVASAAWLERRADDAKRDLTTNHLAAEEAWNRSRLELERRLAESEQGLREKTRELEEARQTHLSLAPTGPNGSGRRVDSHHTHAPPAPRPAPCDRYDPLCAELP